MPKPYIKYGLLIVAIVVLLASFIPALLGAPPSIFEIQGAYWLRDFVFDFQTLITGALAVLAAYLTVVAGLEIDAKQQDRHDETTALTLRADLRTMDRALYPQLTDFSEIVDNNLWATDYNPEDMAPDNNWAWLSDISANHLSEMMSLNSIMERQQFKDGLLLFDGRVSRAYYVFKASYEISFNLIEAHANALQDASYDRLTYSRATYEVDWEESHEWKVATVNKFAVDAQALRKELARASEDYKKLVARYGHRAGLSVTP